MGAIVSAVANVVEALISAVANVLLIVVSTLVTIIVSVLDVIIDILCCNCFGGRSFRTGTHVYKFGKRGGTTGASPNAAAAK
ncbi:hypothetical protein QCA50_015010 [Cerrena zonata]|uniref:Uncharacterized protein n=1 Tax=Cerrena zonata TaxID=2478898 RepID=A0AAW0FMJ1_9APHY